MNNKMILAASLILGSSAQAFAQHPASTAPQGSGVPAASSASASTTQASTSVAAPANETSLPDGPRFRWGIAGTAGGAFVTGGLSGIVGGASAQLGLQVNNLLAIYAEPTLVFGSLGAGAFTGVTGFFGATVVADFSFADRFFAGAGAGYGVLNNPSGPMIQIKGGFFPFMGREGARRTGLSVGADLRVYFATGITCVNPAVTIGYAAF